MADDFIPLNQSTPVRKDWSQETTNYNTSSFQHNRSFGFRGRRGGRNNNNRRGNHSQFSSFNSDSSFGQQQHQQSKNNSFGQQHHQQSKYKIDDYILPYMLQDPWAKLKQQAEVANSFLDNVKT